MKIPNIFGLGLFLGFVSFTNSIDLKSDTFLVKNVIITDINSMIIQAYRMNKFHCFQTCLSDPYCFYVKYEGKKCSFFTQYAQIQLDPSSEKIIYQKNNLEPKTCLKNSSVFWSLKKNACLPCLPAFIKYSESPHYCYHSQSVERNFFQTNSYCQSKGGFIYTPKAQNERNPFKHILDKSAFVNSTVTTLGEIFKWPDGSVVTGFTNSKEPDHLFPIECCLGIINGLVFDLPCDMTRGLTICQHE
ncbi:unnamed protein product [Brachionus calyciflorus]|uniref:C-type lectin domain-containing protein n=1 Tax=Brachionus calyciflorus TaxID=104777 RepID=A0A814HG02_9BILA|nr:unnamed protein product [Brachionus calyciflorus]